MAEIWKPIRGFTGYYEVSSLGRVKSLARVILRSDGAEQTVRERLLRMGGVSPYKEVNLAKHGVLNRVQVHILVAKTFLKKPVWADRVCHRNDVPDDNRVSNLYWGNASTNGIDAHHHGRHAMKVMPSGEDVYNAHSDETVRKVRRHKARGFTNRECSKKFGVDVTIVSQMINYRGRFEKVQ